MADTTPTTIVVHITASDQGWSPTRRRTCHPMNANMAAIVSAAANLQGAMGSSDTRCRPTSWRGGGFGGTVVHVGALDGDTSALTECWIGIRVVISALVATDDADALRSTGGGKFAPRDRGSSGSMSSSSAHGLSNLRENRPASHQPATRKRPAFSPGRVERLTERGGASDTLDT